MEYKNLFHEEPKLKHTYKGKDVAKWMSNQKEYLRKGILSPDRVELLAEIGIKNE